MTATRAAADLDSTSASEVALAALGDAVQEALGGVVVQDSIPPDDTTRAVALVPLGLARLGRIQQGDTVVELRLRVLAVTAGPRPLADLETLLLALDHVPQTEVEREEPPLQLWPLLGARPRPAAVVRLAVPVALPSTPTAPVLFPMRVEVRQVRTCDGLILGPNSVPLPYGVVRAQAFDREVIGDDEGRFRIAVPVDDDHVALTVEVKGRTFTVDALVPEQGPIVVHCEREETP
jgi:hypothetical protein